MPDIKRDTTIMKRINYSRKCTKFHVYTPKSRTSEYLKQIKELKGKRGKKNLQVYVKTSIFVINL